MNSILGSIVRNGARLQPIFARLILSLFALVPVAAFASGGENVKLQFQASDKMYLFISLGMAAIAIVAGFMIRSWVLKQSAGTAKMIEVSGAIRDGAMAYLRQQVKTMSVFVIVIAVGLFALYWQRFSDVTLMGLPIALWLSIAFILGVMASYIAGYVGMLMAVAANARVASAAQTSGGHALVVAFRSGAVAGLITVGMGLLGATLIFLVAEDQAMKLLIGFGFGGSLAALFMRVGGGIYTKAADVGADLVGKVEAGIPEDDPRNAATIADNVGDNVGDCAGMAADVFESYEVTLVAAIVLGAATAAVFDQQTWMKLILFALMARGVGIVASIAGIFMVKGRDDDSDPLTPISKGFWGSAAIAAVLTGVLAFFMMKDINVTFYKDASGKIATGLTPINLDDLRILGLVQQAETQNEATGTATKPAEPLKPDQVVTKVNEIQDQMSAMLPPTAKKPPKVSQIDVNRVQALSIANYGLISQNQRVGGVAQVISMQLGVNPVLVNYKLASQPGQPPQPDEKSMWAPVDNDKLQQNPPGVTIIEKVPLQLSVNPAGDLYWATTKPIKDAKALYYLPSFEYVKTKSEAKKTPGEPDFAMPDGKATAVTATTNPVEWWRFFGVILFGILLAYVIERLTDYFVSFEKKPVKEVAATSTAGPAPMIISGFAYAMESSVWSVLTIVIALLAPLFIFPPAEFGGFILSFYGIALVGLGLLTTTGYILAMDTFGPISDNAQGVYEMSGAHHDEVKVEGKMAGSRAVQRLDAAGNTTKALTKGFAIATAVVAAVALFHSFIEDARLTEAGLRLEIPQIFIGLLIGGAAPFLFSAFSINAVGRASFQLIGEVRRQFKADPGIMAGTSKPDYGRCVEIVTAAAQKELLGPGILAIAFPVLVAFGLAIGAEHTMIFGKEYNLVGAQALGGFLAGAILSGQLMAVTLANAGGMWDNCKKLIEDGHYGGKGSEAHKAGVVCDTVGDPFKDTAGPALNPLIKVMNLVALLIAPIVIMPLSNMVLGIVVAVCVILLAIAVWWSKRGSIGSELQKQTAEANQ